MRKFQFLALLFSLLIAACSPNKESIYIITTNDMHATIDAFPKLATLVKQYEAKGTVLLVDSGDRVSGNAYVDDAEEAGVPIIELMNAVGYDVATLGNHEFDKGPEVLNTMIERSEFKWICANTHSSKTPELEQSAAFNINGVDICFVGIVTTESDGHPLGKASVYEAFTFENDIDCAQRMANALASENNFIVLLSHMGYDMDLRLAQSDTCHYDWIAGGHSHDLKNEDVGTTHISQNNKNLRYATIAELSIEGGKIISIEYQQVDMSTIEEDAAMRQLVDQIKLSDTGLNEVIATATHDATHDGVANLTVEALAHYPYPNDFVPEISFYHFGGVRLSEIKKGDIHRVDILNNDPFLSTIYLGEMTPEQMRKFILDKYNSGTAERPDKESHYPYFRSDVPYQIILDEEGNATEIKFDLEEGRKYRVAMGNYIAESYIDKEIVSKQLHDTNISVREAMLHYINTLTEGYTPDNTIHQTEVKPSK
ncbi:MAG: bifunctional metallophosphatase/5'-nucleotidase [Alistipes sp.]|nr:bifunctional metallophosphatase/5'-nucleotidase [Alistipes sp.]